MENELKNKWYAQTTQVRCETVSCKASIQRFHTHHAVRIYSNPFSSDLYFRVTNLLSRFDIIKQYVDQRSDEGFVPFGFLVTAIVCVIGFDMSFRPPPRSGVVLSLKQFYFETLQGIATSNLYDLITI